MRYKIKVLIKNDFLKHQQPNINVEAEKCHDDAETSAFNVNIRLFMTRNYVTILVEEKRLRSFVE